MEPISHDKANLLHKIYRSQTMAADWILAEGEYHQNDEVGFDLNGEKYRGTLEFTRMSIAVKLTQPYHAEVSKIYRVNNCATDRTSMPVDSNKEKVRELLTDIYADICILRELAPHINITRREWDSLVSGISSDKLVKLQNVLPKVFMREIALCRNIRSPRGLLKEMFLPELL